MPDRTTLDKWPRAIRLTSILCWFAASTWLTACGGGSVVVSSGKPGNPGETNIGSPLPSAIRIPQIDSGDGYAYVLTTAPPLGIFRFALQGEAPYSFDYFDLFGKIRGIPDELLIVDEGHAFMTTSGGVGNQGEGIHLFDPTPSVPGAFSLTESVAVFEVNLDFPRMDSADNPVSHLLPSYTSGVAHSNGKLYVCTSNFTATGENPVCPPGTILIYRWDPDAGTPTIVPADPSFLVTTGYNPTEVTALGDRSVLVTNTGVIAVREGKAVPLTEASVDVIDTESDCIVATFPLGEGALSYKRIAITPDQSRALLGSVAYNTVFEIDLAVLDGYLGSCPNSVPRLDHAVLAGLENPILVGPGQERVHDFIVQVGLNWDGTKAFATGYNSGTVSILEVETRQGLASPKVPTGVMSLTPALDPQAPVLEEVGPGPLALRPGRPGIDYSGPDLFILTGLPAGIMLSIQTY